MGYYENLHKAKVRFLNGWLPLIKAGEEVDFNHILYDLEKNNIIVSEKAIMNYINRVAKIEGYDLTDNIITLK